ncbi:MAG: COX15/CtaA family protein, partial [Gammaproteobacteria bacterium]
MMGAGVFLRLALVATVLAYGVVVLGATVRLAGAGLSCPDWPGCYGEIIVPQG